MIEATNLVKRYGPTLAVDDLTFRIEPGQVVGFLGPNGAGKSTTLRILTGYMPATSGRVTVAGHDVLTESLAVRSKIGYLPENTPLYPEMRVEEYLRYRGTLQKMDRGRLTRRIDEVVELCSLGEVRRRLIGRLSRGNRQRVGLAQALLHEPPVLVLDEPTAGLDPNQITQFRELIDRLRGKHTVMLSTHILPEVERVADRVIVIASGRIAAQGTPEELRRRVTAGSRVVVELKSPDKQVVEALGGLESVREVRTTMSDGWCRAVVSPKDDADIREALGQEAMRRGWAVREMRHESASLEQFFIQITAEQSIVHTGAA